MFHNPGHSGSESAAGLLRESGYDAKALKGGFPAWAEAGFEVASGPD